MGVILLIIILFIISRLFSLDDNFIEDDLNTLEVKDPDDIKTIVVKSFKETPSATRSAADINNKSFKEYETDTKPFVSDTSEVKNVKLEVVSELDETRLVDVMVTN